MTYLIPHIAVLNASNGACTDEAAVPTAANVWKCRILDKSDVQGAGGYHEETHGVPDLKVFAGDLKRFGASVSVAFSHEVLYLLHDLTNIVRGGETNYVMATLNLFLSVYNIFISLLNLLLMFSGQRD